MDGELIEGKGTMPDIYIEMDKETLLGKRDNQLEIAYITIFDKLRETPTPGGLTAIADTAMRHPQQFWDNDEQENSRIWQWDERFDIEIPEASAW